MSGPEILESVAVGVGVIGVAVILWGVVTATVTVVKIELANLRKHRLPRERVRVRQQLGSSLLLGLEFLIAADVIRTVLQPTIEEVGILGGIVAIRTVISYFLHKELALDLDAMTEGKVP